MLNNAVLVTCSPMPAARTDLTSNMLPSSFTYPHDLDPWPHFLSTATTGCHGPHLYQFQCW